MAMAASTKEGEPMMDINTTPLIDVMLVLLVMLIITIPVQSHAVKLDMPQQTPPPETPVEPVIVKLEIQFDGAVFWNGSPVADTQTLRDYFKSAALSDPQPEIHIEPDAAVEYGYVAIVLAEAQKQGVTRIGFAGNEKYLND